MTYYLYLIFRCHNYHSIYIKYVRLNLWSDLISISLFFCFLKIQDDFIWNQAVLSLIETGFLEHCAVPLWSCWAPHSGSSVPLPVGTQLLISSAFCSWLMDQIEDDVDSIWKVSQPVFEETYWRPRNSALNTDSISLETDREGKMGLASQWNQTSAWSGLSSKMKAH